MAQKDKYQAPTLVICNMSTVDVIKTSIPTVVSGTTFETGNEFNDWY